MGIRQFRYFRHAQLAASAHRTPRSDRRLAYILACIAGAVNAGGFLLLGQYTSHMTGYMSQIADQIVLQNFTLAFQGMMAVALFLSGAICSAFIINWAKAFHPRQRFSLPIGLQGALLLAFAFSGRIGLPLYGAQMLGLAILSFVMGLQNATITKISGAVIRTTHVTGIVTDIGIELGRGLFGQAYRVQHARGNREKLRLLAGIVLMFFFGGLVGALGYSFVGTWFSVPMAMILLAISALAALRPRRAAKANAK
ncbi:YoaK family protein [Abyssibius alkaniclasticus]|uniref:YoaK family protein n=1 Tax=Abyssibius alkaniclasticus TaxID=2881234 RepID=UPI004057D4BB